MCVRGGRISRVAMALVLLGTGLVLVGREAAAAPPPATTGPVSVSSTGQQPTSGNSDQPSVTRDGRYVVFTSTSNTLVSGDTNGVSDVFRKDLHTGEIVLVSRGIGNNIGNLSSDSPEITDDGRQVIFRSVATNLVPSDSNGLSDIFIRDLVTGTTIRLTGSSTQLNGASSDPTISADGSIVAFVSEATNASTTPDTNGQRDVFLINRDTNENGVLDDSSPFVRPVSRALNSGAGVPGPSDSPELSDDGLHIVFVTYNEFFPDGPVASTEPFVWMGSYHFGSRVTPVSVDADGLLTTGTDPTVSADGTWVAYASTDQTISGPNGAGRSGIYARVRLPGGGLQRDLGPPVWVTPAADGGAVNGDSTQPAMSADGRSIAFTTSATNLDTSGDTNGRPDIYVATRHIEDKPAARVSLTAAGQQSSGAGAGSGQAAVSAAANTVVFTTSDALVGGGDANPGIDVVARIRSEPVGSFDLLSRDPDYTGNEFTGVSIGDIAPEAVRLVTDELSATPLSRIGLQGIPLSRIPLSRIDVLDSPLSRIPLSRIPLSRIGGWEAALEGTPLAGLPIESITLEQVLAFIDANPTSNLATIALEELDLRDSPLSRISLSSIALAGLPLSRIPLDGEPTTAPEMLADWCEAIAGVGYDCSELGVDNNSTVLALDLAGVPLSRIPLSRIPLSRIDIVDTPLSRIPLSRIVLSQTPLSRIPLSRIPLSRIDPTASPLSRIPLSRIDAFVLDFAFDCALVDCVNGTLGDAGDAGAIRETASLGDLIGAFGEGADELLLSDLYEFLPESFTFGDLLLSLIKPLDYPWEDIPLDELKVQRITDGISELPALVNASVDLPGGSAPIDARLEIELLAGTVLERVTGAIVTPTGVMPLPDPVEQGQLSSFIFDDLPNGSTIAMEVRTSQGLVLTEGTFEARFIVDDVVVSEGQSITTAENPDREGFERSDNDTPDAVPQDHAPDVLYYGWIPEADDVDYYRIPAPPAGLQTVVSVSAVAGDLDVGLFQATTPAPLNGAPTNAIGLGSVPLTEGQPDGSDPGGVSEDAGSELLGEDTEGLTLADSSTEPGTVEETVTVTSTEGEADETDYLVRVSSYDGGTSNRPYVLRYRYVAPATDPACPARVLPSNDGTTGSLMPALPAGVNTIFVVNRDRLGDTYGATEATATIAALNGLATRGDLGVTGAVLEVDGDAGVQAAYAAWDAAPCATAGANDVVGAISQVVASRIAATPGAADSVKSIVLVGADDLVPFARVPDTTRIANESDYAVDLRSADGSSNPLSASATTRHVLSDDPYGDRDPIPWLDRFLYVPDFALGRLVETPDQVRAAVAQFEASGGVLDAETALTTGYDFLDDGAAAVDAALGRRIGDANRTLLAGETWDRDDVDANLFGGAAVPGIASLNAHYDHSGLLPGAANGTDFTASDLYTTADIANQGPAGMLGSLVFTMGCHAGASVPDVYVGADEDRLDWAQAYASAGAIYVANTGFGLGDTHAVALSERLMALFANRLDGNLTAGDALTVAKNEYLGGLGLYSNYDEKVLMQTTFYGLPMYRLGPPVVPPAPAPPAPTVTGSGSVKSASLTIEPTFATETGADGTTYLTADGEYPQVSPARPIVPRVTESLTHPFETAHDALIVDLESTFETDVVNSVASPVIDNTAGEPAVRFDDGSFPASFLNVTNFRGRLGDEQQLVVLPTRVEGYGDSDQRERFTRTDVQVFYSDDPDHVAPQVSSAAQLIGNAVQFTVDASDLDELGESAGTTRAVVLFDVGGGWQPVELTQTEPGRWTGSAPTPAGTTAVRWFAQVVDAAGNVGIDTARGQLERLSTLAPSFNPGGLATVAYGDRLFRNVTFTDADSSRWTAAVDIGTGFQPVPVDGQVVRIGTFPATPGERQVSLRICDDGGSCTTETFPLRVIDGELPPPPDTAPPVVTGTPDRAPNAAGWYRGPVTITWSATDADPSSGAPTIPPPTTVTADGTDMAVTSAPSCDPAGNCATGSVSLSIDQVAPAAALPTGLLSWLRLLTTSYSGTATDDRSGVASVEVTFKPYFGGAATVRTATLNCDATRRTCTWTVVTPPPGFYLIDLRTVDVAGNVTAASSPKLIVFHH